MHFILNLRNVAVFFGLLALKFSRKCWIALAKLKTCEIVWPHNFPRYSSKLPRFLWHFWILLGCSIERSLQFRL